MRFLFTIGVFLIGTAHVLSQEKTTNQSGNFLSDSSTVLASNEILFTGIDFSLFHLVNPAKLKQDVFLRKYFTGWYDYLLEKTRLTKRLKQVWKKSKFNPQLTVPGLNKEWIVAEKQPRATTDDLYELLLALDLDNSELNSMDIALLIVPEEFNKFENLVYVRYVFFNPSTKNIYWAPSISGIHGSMGMTRYWAQAMYDANYQMMQRCKRSRKEIITSMKRPDSSKPSEP